MIRCGRRSEEITISKTRFSSPVSTLDSCKLSDLTNTSGV